MSAESQPARELLIDLVSTPSPSGEESEAADRLVDFFEAHDREAFIDEVGNVRAPADDRILLTSHIDTVPGEIPVKVDDGVLWGRGSVDATGPLVAMACAAVETGVSFVGVVGEETDSRGAWHLIEEREAPDAVVNGEPSGWDGITLGYRGMLSGTYVATSESGHTSRPEPNAVQHAIRWWNRVEDRFEPDDDEEGVAPWAQRSEGVHGSEASMSQPEAPPSGDVDERSSSDSQNSESSDDGDAAEVSILERVTTKPVDIDGGTDADGLSVSSTLDGQFRVPPPMTVEEVREIADGELEAGTVNWNRPIPPVMESPRTDLARAFRAAIRESGGDPRLLRKTGTSDMNIYASAWDCPMVTYGPGDSDLDHAPDERLALDEFDRSIAVLTEVTERL